MINFIKLGENDKKFFIILFLAVIIVFVIVGYLASLVKRVMKYQGSKADQLLKNVTDAEYFKTESQFVKFGIKKNIRCFFNEAKIPFAIMACASILLLVYCIITENWGYNPFSKTEGFGTILYEFSEWPKTKFFFMRIVNGFPQVVRKPHLVASAWVSYIFVPALIVGGAWYLFCTQAYIARSIRTYKIARSIYRKKLTPPSEPTNDVSENSI